MSTHNGYRSQAPKSLDRPVRHAMGPWSRNPELHPAQAQTRRRCPSRCPGPPGQMAQVHRSERRRLEICMSDVERNGKTIQPAPFESSSHISHTLLRRPTMASFLVTGVISLSAISKLPSTRPSTSPRPSAFSCLISRPTSSSAHTGAIASTSLSSANITPLSTMLV